MSLVSEFKEFAVKGNVIDMAVGIIIGGAFGTIAKSVVSDLIMPPVGLLVGGIDFGDLHVVLKGGADGVSEFANLEAAQKAGAVTLNYGLFLNHVISFLIVAFSVFLLVKAINRARRIGGEEPPPDPTTKECPACCSAIALKATRCPQCTTDLSPAATT